MLADPSSIRQEFDQRLPLREPVPLPEDRTGHALRSVRSMNQLLREVFAATATDLPKLIAQVRTSLGLPRKPFAEAAGMSGNGYAPMECDLDGRMPHRIKYTKTMNAWRVRGVAEGIREQCLDLLSPPECLYAFYHRMGFDCGHEAVERRFPSLWNTWWQRRKDGVVPDFLEVCTHVDVLYPHEKGSSHEAKLQRDRRERRMLQAQRLWTDEKGAQLQARGLEEPLIMLLTALERWLAEAHGSTLTLHALQAHCGFGPKHAAMLAGCELPPWEAVAQVAERAVGPEACRRLAAQWRAALRIERERASFARLSAEAMRDRGFTAGDVARLLDVKPPEERIAGYTAPKRRQRYRGDSEVRHVMLDNGVSSQVPVDPFITVISEDDRQRERLRTVYAEERARHYRRTGSGLHGEGLDMRVARELAGVSTADLARQLRGRPSEKRTVRATDIALQKLERQEGRAHPFSFTDVLPVIEEIGAEKVHAALERLARMGEIPEELLAWESVRHMAACLVQALRGARNISRAMRDTAPTDGHWLRYDLILATAKGDYVPPLPALRHMAASTAQRPLPDAVEEDWHDAFPAALHAREHHPMRHPLARMLTTMIARKEPGNAATFYRERCPGSSTRWASLFYRLQRYSELPPLWLAEETMLAAGVARGTPAWRLAAAVHAHNALRPALREICPSLDATERRPTELIGITGKEIGITATTPDTSPGSPRGRRR